MEIPAEQLKVLNDLGTSGDSTAKDMLSTFTPPSVPEKTEEKTESNAHPEKTPEATPEVQPKESAEVDDGRSRDGDDRKPSKIDTIRELRRERRQLREEVASQKAREERFNQQLATLQAKLDALSNGKPATTEKDTNTLERLLAAPDELLSERDKRLKDELIKTIDERFKNLPGMLGGILQTRDEKSEARKLVGSIKGLDLDRDEDQILEYMEEDYGLDENELAQLLDTKPLRTAQWIKKAWESRMTLPPEKKADKAAASSGQVSGSPVPVTKPTLKDLNARFAQARTEDERARILKELESVTS